MPLPEFMERFSLARSKQYGQVNREARSKEVFARARRSRELAQKRYDAIKRQTPKWADLDKIKEIYRNCPQGYHVDHDIPLQGHLVSGLHVEDNLKYLTVPENLEKSNKFIPEIYR